MSESNSGVGLRSGIDRRQRERRVKDPGSSGTAFADPATPRSGRDRRGGVDRRRAPAIRMPREKVEAAVEVIENAQLKVVYQPVYELGTGSVYGYEALARVDSPAFETLLELFQAASAAGRIGQLGRLHRSQAVANCPSQPLFINIFPTEFDYGLLVRPDDAIFRHKFPVYLEITESVPLNHFNQCVDVLGELRKKGMFLAIDDLGAGYSNLKYIADLTPDMIKLDRNLIENVRDGTRQARLVSAIVSLCKQMGARVVAEGIETVDELIAVERAGVEFCQGYLLGRPSATPEGDSWPGFL